MDLKINQSVKGLSLDTLDWQIDNAGVLTYALNANIQSLDGNRFTYTNETSNQLCTVFKPGFVVLGFHNIIEENKVIFFLHNPITGESEIGEVTSYNIDCTKLVTTKEDCGCDGGVMLSDEVVFVPKQTEIPCVPKSCSYYFIENGVHPTNSVQIYYTDCKGKYHGPGDVDTTILGQMLGVSEFHYIDPEAKVTFYSTLDLPCENIKIEGGCCTYRTIINSDCLNFDINYPVYSVHKQTACDTKLYFVSRNNPPRHISLLTPKGEDACGKPNTLLSCEDLNMFPKSCHPQMTPVLQNSGGQIKAGTVQFTIAYSDKLGNEFTDYFDLTNPISVFEKAITFDTDYITSKSVTIDVKHHTNVFDYFNVVVAETVNETTAYYLIGTYKVSGQQKITYTGRYKEEYSSIRTLNRTPFYEKANIINNSDNVLFLADLEADIEYNLQPLVNQIPLHWQTIKMPANNKNFNYHNGIVVSNFRSYMRDEVYGFGLKFKLKNGKYTKVYHLPGPQAKPDDLIQLTVDDKDVFLGEENCDQPNKVPAWKVYNSAKKKTLPPVICANQDLTLQKEFDCEIHLGDTGEFGYFESTHRYPCNEDIWGALADQPIRFHKFPDCAITHIHNNHSPSTRDEIYPIGVRPDINVINDLLNNYFIYNPKTKKKDILLRDLVCGFELVRTNRVGNKSILAKGLVYDVAKFEEQGGSGNKYYFPNYPFNDLREDPYISNNKAIYDSSDQGDAYKFSGYTRNPADKIRFTLHSPDTHFQYPKLGTEMKLESCEYGKWQGHFVPVAEHPKYKFLTKFDFALSALVGTALSASVTNSTKDVVTPPANVGSESHGELSFNFAEVLSNTSLFKELLEKAIPKTNYAWQFNSVASYDQAVFPTKGNIRRRLSASNYLSPNNQFVDDDLPIRNYQRESSVYCKINNSFNDLLPAVVDNSRETLSSFKTRRGIDWCDNPTNIQTGDVKANYVSIKRTLPDQYGPLDNISYITTGDFYRIDALNDTLSAVQCKYYPTFGGDIFINKFSLKRKMPFFIQNMVGRPDEIPFDYWLVPNVGYPKYFAGSSPDTITIGELGGDLSTILVGLGILGGASALPVGGTLQKIANILGYTTVGIGSANLLSTVLSSFVPKNNLDCDNGSRLGHTSKLLDIDLLSSNGLVHVDSFLFGLNKDTNWFYQEGKFYLASYGIPTFYVESDINVDMRHGRNHKEENFYPNVGSDIPDEWLQEVNVPISFDNYYSYNATYSKQNYENYNEPYRDFKPDEICKSYFPNRVIYSDMSSQEEDRDSWLIYRTNNYYDFPKTNGKLIELNSIENDKILARMENTTQVYNSRIVLDSSYPTQLELGTGSMFAQKPIDYVKADLGYIGTQNKAYVSCKYGSFWTDAKRGFVYQISPSGFDEISKSQFNWFKNNLPFRILEDYPNFNIDNNFKGIGITLGWDERFERLFLTKLDYKVIDATRVKYDSILQEFRDSTTNNIIELDNPEYFENKSFTMAYSPILKNWISFYSFLPNYYIGHTTHFQTGNKSGLWNHLLTPFSHQVFYNKKYPYIIEYPINFLPNESQLNSVTIHQDIQKYYDKTNYYSISSLNKEDKINFNKAIIYNKEQTSGALNLIPKDPSNMRQKLQYPKTSSNGVDILCSFSEHKFTFNGFWDTVRNTNSNQPIFSSSWIDTKDSYPTDKVLNNSAIQYSTSHKRIPLKSKECRVRLINDTHTRYKFINHLLVTQTQKSIT
jgi:hypothetical protein